MSTDLTSFSGLYIQTAREYVEQMKKAVDVLVENSADSLAIESLFIAAHSLKSQSSVMGYMTTSEASKLLEHLFRAAKETRVVLTKEMVAQAGLLVKKIDESIQTIAKINKELNLSNDIEGVKAVIPNID